MTPRPSAPALQAHAVGVGFKPEHYQDVLGFGHGIGFFEVHAENYMGDGGPPHRMLSELSAHVPAVASTASALSIGGAGPLDPEHLGRLKRLIDRYRPALFSEHLAWSTHDGVYLNDLLPLPYNEETLAACLRAISTRCRRRFSGACCWKTHRPMSPSRHRP